MSAPQDDVRPQPMSVWGVVNVTPDSFSDGGRFFDPDAAIAHARALRAVGATVLDVGGESTRPGAERISPEEEQRRVLPVIAALSAEGAVVSVDTLNARTAQAAVELGAQWVNDVSGGLADPDMLHAVAESGAQLALGHWRGPSVDMYARAAYDRIGREVAAELAERAQEAEKAGIPPFRLVVDPGIGFAKTPAQSWQLLRELDEVVALGLRVLVGTSRKRMLAAVVGDDPARKDLATAVTSVLAADAGVWGVRVHDVAATVAALTVRVAWRGEADAEVPESAGARGADPQSGPREAPPAPDAPTGAAP